MVFTQLLGHLLALKDQRVWLLDLLTSSLEHKAQIQEPKHPLLESSLALMGPLPQPKEFQVSRTLEHKDQLLESKGL